VTLCIPHWQGGPLIKLCLRSIRRFSDTPTSEVIVVDNGSKDGTLDWLRSVRWIRLIERPEETHDNWPRNVATAWDLGVREARGKHLLIMHADVFVRRAGWLKLLVDALECDEQVAAAGGWKLETPGRFSAVLKRFGNLLKRHATEDEEVFPRDYCAIYRLAPIREHHLSFVQHVGSAGQEMFRQLKSCGYRARMIPVAELMRFIHHVAHGTAGVVKDAPLGHRRAQRKVVRRTKELLMDPLVLQLLADDSLDR
jgi:glycosyltransferase involved in cell wall biosynthesis